MHCINITIKHSSHHDTHIYRLFKHVKTFGGGLLNSIIENNVGYINIDPRIKIKAIQRGHLLWIISDVKEANINSEKTRGERNPDS